MKYPPHSRCKRPDISTQAAYDKHSCRCLERCLPWYEAKKARRGRAPTVYKSKPSPVTLGTPQRDPRLADPAWRAKVLEDEWARRVCEDGENWWASDRPGAFQRELAKRPRPPVDSRSHHNRHTYLSRDTFGFGWGS